MTSRVAWIENPKIIFHPSWLKRWREDPFSVPPIYIEISPVGQCNHRCTFCAPEMLGYVNRQLDTPLLAERFDEMRQMRESDPDGLGVKSVQIAGEGEPTLHKDLAGVAAAARNSGLDVGLFTNATGLNKALSDKLMHSVNSYIQISLNAGAKDTYAALHQTTPKHWDLVWKNIADAVRARTEADAAVDLGINMVAIIDETKDDKGRPVPPNWSEVESLVRLGRDVGVDYVSIKPYSQHPYSEATEKRYGNMSYRDKMKEINETGQHLVDKYNSDNFEVVFRFTRFEDYEDDDRKYDTCRATPTLWSYIQSDGLWISCSAFWTDPRFALGNIKEQTVKEIWFGSKRKAHLDFVCNSLDISVCRKTCHPDKENVYLNKLYKMSDHEFRNELVQISTLTPPKRANFI